MANQRTTPVLVEALARRGTDCVDDFSDSGDALPRAFLCRNGSRFRGLSKGGLASLAATDLEAILAPLSTSEPAHANSSTSAMFRIVMTELPVSAATRWPVVAPLAGDGRLGQPVGSAGQPPISAVVVRHLPTGLDNKDPPGLWPRGFVWSG